MNHDETHTACDARLKAEGGQARCCGCVPHDGCELNAPQPTAQAGEACPTCKQSHLSSDSVMLTCPDPFHATSPFRQPAPPTPSAGERRTWIEDHGFEDHGFYETSPGSDRCRECPHRRIEHVMLGEPASPQLPTPELDFLELAKEMKQFLEECGVELLTDTIPGNLAILIQRKLAAQAKAADERFEAANGEDEEIPDDDDKTDQIMVIAQNAHRKEARQRWYKGGNK